LAESDNVNGSYSGRASDLRRWRFVSKRPDTPSRHFVHRT